MNNSAAGYDKLPASLAKQFGETHMMPYAYLSPLIRLQGKDILSITFSHYLEHSEPLFKQLVI